MKPRNSAIVHYLIFLATWWEWEKQKLYLQSSLPATSYPLRKYPNLSVAQVLCWWEYHQMLFSGGRTKHRDAQQSAKLNFWGFIIYEKAEIWKILGSDTKTCLAEPRLKASSSLSEHLSVPWGKHNVCGDAAPFPVLDAFRKSTQPWQDSSSAIDLGRIQL